MQSRNIKSKYTKDDALKTIDRNIIWINTADNKSSILLGVFSFIFGGALFTLDTKLIIEIAENGTTDQRILAFISSLFVMVIGLTVLATPILLILVILSRTKSKAFKPVKQITYFNDISSLDYEDFSDTLKQIKDIEILEDLISQVYITSKIASKKYKILNWAYLSFTLFFVATFIYSLLMYFLRAN